MKKQDFINKWIGWVSYSDREKLAIEMESDLQEIEKELSQDNWTKIENEDYLPEQGGVYHIVVNGKLSKGTYLKNNRWYVAGNDYPKTTELHGITHYHKIITPDLPTNQAVIPNGGCYTPYAKIKYESKPKTSAYGLWHMLGQVRIIN